MIFYIASYPRSGNTWTRRLIANHFERSSVSWHGGDPSTEGLLAWLLLKPDNDNNLVFYHSLLSPDNKNLDPDFVYYHPVRDDSTFYRCLIPSCKYILEDPNRRAELAESGEHFFVKIHVMPFASYLPGEYVIQPIRNAGACCWSYYNYLHDVQEKMVSLENVLLGNVGFGHWNAYHQEWHKASETLGDRYLPLYYEEMFDELATCKKLEAFTGLPLLHSDFKPFAYYHHRRPKHARKGQAYEWEENYTNEQLALLWQEHGEMMAYHGYPNPLKEKNQPQKHAPKQNNKPAPNPVFITARFRTGSTMLWNLFRQIPEATAFYEPLHEELLAFIQNDIEPQPEHFHVESYFDEYTWLNEALRQHDAGFGTKRLYLEADANYPALKNYISGLLNTIKEEQTPVLKFNRIDFRLGWMRVNFPQARILHLYRSPRTQWHSSLVGLPPDSGADLNADPYRITTWSRDLCGAFPFLASPYLENPYQRFYYLWKLSYLAGTRQADWSISYEEILANPGELIPGILDFAGLDTVKNRESALKVIEPAPQRRWTQHEPEEWFEAQEQHCEDVLDELGLNQNFGLKPIAEIIRSSQTYTDMVQSSQSKTWALENSIRVLIQQQNDLNAKEQVIQQMDVDLKKKETLVETLKNSLLSYHKLLQENTPGFVQDLHDQLAAKEEVIQDLKHAAQTREEQIELLQTDLRETQSSLTELERQVGSSEVVRDLQDDLVAKENFIQEQIFQIKDLQSRLHIAQRVISDQEAGENVLDIIENLHGELDAKEEVIQELVRFRRSSLRYWTRGILFPALYRFSLTRQAGKFIKSIRRKFLPRLFVLEQHPPHSLKLPQRYSKSVELPVGNLPVFSIVTPTYNQADFLERTLRSVLEQGYPKLEYILQDGGSTDGTVAILDQYRSRLAVTNSQPDDGQTQAINLGFSHAHGEIMAYLNSDDILLPGALAYVAQFFMENPETDVVYSHRIIIDEQDRQVGQWILPPHDPVALQYADYVPQETLFWRRRIWENTGGQLDERFQFAMDWDLLLRFQDAGAKFTRVPRPLAAFRVHPAQKTAAQIADIGKKEMKVLRERCAGRPVPPEETNQYLRPYLRRSVLYHHLFRTGVLQ